MHALSARVGATYTTQIQALNTVCTRQDPNDQDRGVQEFVFKTVFDAGVATSVGSPVGVPTADTNVETVTPDQSDSTSTGILGLNGGVALVAVAANTTNYQFIQCRGVGRVALLTGGAVVDNSNLEWSGDNTVIAQSGGLELIFGRNAVAAASNQIAAGGYVLY